MTEIDDLIDRVSNTKVAIAVEHYGLRWAPIIHSVILTLIVLLAFFIRLFAVIRFESVIHEFDPHFNWRTTEYLAEQGYLCTYILV